MGTIISPKAFVRTAALLLALAAAAHAQDAGDAGGEDSGSDSTGSESGDGGYDGGSDDVGAPGDFSASPESAPPESTDPSGAFAPSGPTPGARLPNASSRAQLDEFSRGADGALEAVEADRALPLDSIVGAARHLTDGQIIDARLKNVKGGLQYELKVLEASGQVRRYFFQARTGQLQKVR